MTWSCPGRYSHPGDLRAKPLAVFELDFEANLEIIRPVSKYKKRVPFLSTSKFTACVPIRVSPYESNLVLGPLNKSRWIYSCAKQLLDRVIAAYGQQEGLDYTLFRPFNWVGSGLDSMHTPKEGSSRVLTQFLGHIEKEARKSNWWTAANNAAVLRISATGLQP